MKVLFIISTEDAETSDNAMRLANVAVKKEGDDILTRIITRSARKLIANGSRYRI